MNVEQELKMWTIASRMTSNLIYKFDSFRHMTQDTELCVISSDSILL